MSLFRSIIADARPRKTKAGIVNSPATLDGWGRDRPDSDNYHSEEKVSGTADHNTGQGRALGVENPAGNPVSEPKPTIQPHSAHIPVIPAREADQGEAVSLSIPEEENGSPLAQTEAPAPEQVSHTPQVPVAQREAGVETAEDKLGQSPAVQTEPLPVSDPGTNSAAVEINGDSVLVKQPVDSGRAEIKPNPAPVNTIPEVKPLSTNEGKTSRDEVVSSSTGENRPVESAVVAMATSNVPKQSTQQPIPAAGLETDAVHDNVKRTPGKGEETGKPYRSPGPGSVQAKTTDNIAGEYSSTVQPARPPVQAGDPNVRQAGVETTLADKPMPAVEAADSNIAKSNHAIMQANKPGQAFSPLSNTVPAAAPHSKPVASTVAYNATNTVQAIPVAMDRAPATAQGTKTRPQDRLSVRQPDIPKVQIGQIDVIVEAARPVDRKSASTPSSFDLDSRYFLRRL